MNFEELQAETERLLRLEGWSAAMPSPDLGALVNEALRLFSWEAEYITTTESFPSVVGQPEYDLSTVVPGADWKLVTDVMYGKADLDRESMDYIRVRDPDWIIAGNAQPSIHFMVRPNTLRLYPPPNGVETIVIYGTRADTDLVKATDTPLCPSHYHRSIARLAAWCYGEAYSLPGDGNNRLAGYYSNAMQQAQDLKLWMVSQNQMGLQRNVRRRGPQRVMMTGTDTTVRSV